MLVRCARLTGARRATGARSSRRSSATAPAGCTSFLQPAVARAPARRGLQRRPVRQGRAVPQRAADDQSDRRLIGDRTGRIVPIYPQSEKVQLTTWELAGWVENALRPLPASVASATRCRTAIRRRLDLVERGDALRAIHLPQTIAAKDRARRRLAFDELLRVQLVLVRRKRAIERELRRVRATRSRASSSGASTPPCRTG